MPNPNHRQDLGAQGEQAALDHYSRAGYRVVARNWRCPIGELDLVVARGRTLVFCEVKTRRGQGFGGPFDAVTWRKQQKLRALAHAFLATRPEPWDELRLDVASVVVGAAGGPAVHVFECAF